MSIMLQGGLHEPGGTTQNLFEHDLFSDNKTDFGGKLVHLPIIQMVGL